MITENVKSTPINKNFNLLLSSILLLSVGNKIYEIVLPLLIYELTHSSVSMTTMRTAELLPNFFFAILIGVIVDRVNQGRWALWMVGSQAVLLILFAYLFKANVTNLLFYSIIGFFLMSFNYGFFNVQVSLTKQNVPASKLTQANAKISFIETFVSIMGPAISGIVFLISDMSNGLIMTAVMYMVCLAFLFQLPNREPSTARVRSSFVNDLKEGWIGFTSNRVLFGMTIFVMFINCSFIVVQTCIVFYGKDVLQLSSPMLALTLSMAGLGGLVGSTLVSWLRESCGLGKVYAMSILVHAIACGLITIHTSLTTYTISLTLIGFAVSLHGVAVYTLRHEQTPSHLIGRIAGITGTIFRIGMPIAMYVSGWIIEAEGTEVIFIGAAVWNSFFLLLFIRSRLWKHN